MILEYGKGHAFYKGEQHYQQPPPENPFENLTSFRYFMKYRIGFDPLPLVPLWFILVLFFYERSKASAENQRKVDQIVLFGVYEDVGPLGGQTVRVRRENSGVDQTGVFPTHQIFVRAWMNPFLGVFERLETPDHEPPPMRQLAEQGIMEGRISPSSVSNIPDHLRQVYGLVEFVPYELTVPGCSLVYDKHLRRTIPARRIVNPQYVVKKTNSGGDTSAHTQRSTTDQVKEGVPNANSDSSTGQRAELVEVRRKSRAELIEEGKRNCEIKF